jgi:hypothetical protein
MSLNRVAIGTNLATGTTVHLSLRDLVVTRLLIQATSGGGKSYLIRRLLEQTHGRIQQILIDVEGEFATLREKFDYVYAAKDGGDTNVDPRGASLLAERLLDLRVSAICDLYELSNADRLRFVANFLNALINAPKRLWHPALIVIDEAHHFCPQSDEVESSEGVMMLCSKGRKRGFCTVLATQRLSKLHKDVAAECLNRMMGRTGLDTDVKRAAEELGFGTRAQRQTLPRLKPGEFYAFGPAISTEVIKMKGGPVRTKHPKAGGRIRFQPPPPTRRIRKLLPKLSDLAGEQTQREATMRELQRKVSSSETKIRALEKQTSPKTIPILTTPQFRRLAVIVQRVRDSIRQLSTLPAVLTSAAAPLDVHLRADGTIYQADQLIDVADIGKLSSTMRVLAAIKAHPGGDAKRIGAVARVSSRKSTFRLAIVELRKKTWIRGDYQEGFHLTVDGERAAAHLPAPPTGADLVDQWRRRLGNGVPRQLFDTILSAREHGISAEAIEHDTGIDTRISTFRLGITQLKHHNLISGSRQRFLISSEFL